MKPQAGGHDGHDERGRLHRVLRRQLTCRLSLGGDERRLFRQTLQSFACELVRRIRLAAHITHDAPPTPASLSNFENSNAKAVTGRHATAHNRRAIGAHYHAVMWPPRGGQIESARANVRLELRGPSQVRKAKRFRVHRAASNKNGQATSSPAILVKSGVDVDHQALPQIASLQIRRSRPGFAQQSAGRRRRQN